MKTTILQSLFKIALLLFGMVVGVGCDDSDNPDFRHTNKNRRKRYRDQVPNGDNPLLDLKKRSHIRRRCRVQQHQRRLQIQCRQWAIQNRRFDSD